MFQIDKEPLLAIPVYQPSDKIQKSVAALVDGILRNMAARDAAPTEAQGEAIARRIEATDTQIQTIIFGLYGLTAEEVIHVEANL